MRTRFKAILAAVLALCGAPAPASEIQIELPKGGWRSSENEKLKFMQRVSYPASVVNAQEDQSRYALIRGRIAGAPKEGEPHLLVVNGVAMPLRADGGSFSRPYLFGQGSNSVEIRSPDGRSRSSVQFYERNPSATRPGLSVVLSWDTDQTDLDLHVIGPDGRHCWYGDRVLDNGGALDVDVTTGYGPEIFSTPVPLRGAYLVYVNYYGAGKGGDLTTAQLTIITRQNSPDEKKETVVVPLRQPGELTHVKTFVAP